ncbi:hypothetical protein PC116_g34970 [Phytophthora cactorum]|nr:hypothetical protein PC116_g34970 [Phytophthora cactorum]
MRFMFSLQLGQFGLDYFSLSPFLIELPFKVSAHVCRRYYGFPQRFQSFIVLFGVTNGLVVFVFIFFLLNAQKLHGGNRFSTGNGLFSRLTLDHVQFCS